MSELLQTGQHPDADQLSAFIEHALPAHEHESMLAHLAVCPDCRSVVAVSVPPVAELPEVQPSLMRRPWFSGWNLVWPAAAAFAALILIAVLVRKGGGNAPPAQIAETHLPEQLPVVGGVAQAGLPAARGASPPTIQNRPVDTLQAAKAADGKGVSAPKAEDQGLARLPLDARSTQSLPPSPGPTQPHIMAGTAMGNGSGLALAQQTQVLGGGLNEQKTPSAGAGVPAPASVTAYAMNGLATAPPAASPAPPLPPPPAAVARSGSGLTQAQGASADAAANTVAIDATADEALAVALEVNANSTVSSGASLATIAKTGNGALHPLPSGLPVVSAATAGQTMLALDSGDALFLSGDGGTHWKRIRAKWQGRAVEVALAVTPVAAKPQPAAMNKAEIRGELQGRMSTATATAPIAQSVARGGASLTGQVTDPAGAMIPGAAVTVTNAITAAAVTVKADAAGRYFAGGLAPGAYRIDAIARGFARQELNVTLAASEQAKADLKLQVGQMTETVTVANAPAQIETEGTSLSAEVLKSRTKGSAPPVFAITTNTGERWVSADGQNWKRE